MSVNSRNKKKKCMYMYMYKKNNKYPFNTSFYCIKVGGGSYSMGVITR